MLYREKIPLIAFTGIEGSGKSTQAKMLAAERKFRYISTGDVIRNAAENDLGSFGDACRKMSKEKTYLDPLLILDFLGKMLREPSADNGVVLDGGFRTMEETEHFQSMLESTSKNFRVNIIHIRLAGWDAVNRILESNRGRNDDDAVSVLSRVEKFHRNLSKRMSFIRKNLSLSIVEGKGTVEEVHNRIKTLPL